MCSAGCRDSGRSDAPLSSAMREAVPSVPPSGCDCSGMEAIDLLFNYLRLAFQRTIPPF